MSNTYADYEFAKLKGDGGQLKVTGEGGGETRWISVTEETLAKLLKVLAEAPECSWEV